ncbi:unnamed protein product [Amoebophrya sp. A25]|nr:unnamed protein product [Amoebophrya sp. A25]|eukprot:GSA25T00023081001.1
MNYSHDYIYCQEKQHQDQRGPEASTTSTNGTKTAILTIPNYDNHSPDLQAVFSLVRSEARETAEVFRYAENMLLFPDSPNRWKVNHFYHIIIIMKLLMRDNIFIMHNLDDLRWQTMLTVTNPVGLQREPGPEESKVVCPNN